MVANYILPQLLGEIQNNISELKFEVVEGNTYEIQ